ncbi:MAG TPA: four helix bundle protein [Gemmatimonadales bacterium]|jgi:four helix bundle protein|nr:four helix bundle protein [Gemmatimonadales bacterium]
MGDFRNLKAWQEAKSLATLSAAAIKTLPSYERYALGDQWRRAAYSVVLNLAEGNSRRGPREFRRYLDIARSSLHELEGVFELAKALGYFTEQQLRPLRIKRSNCARLVYALLRRIEEAAARA